MTTRAPDLAPPSPGYTDFVTTDEDLSRSPLWNPDLAPTALGRRTWSTWRRLS